MHTRGLISLMQATILVILSTSTAQAVSENPVLASANRLAAEKSYAQAEKLYLKVIDAAPGNPLARHMYGRVLAIQGRYLDALHQYRLALQNNAKSADILNDVGVVLSILGEKQLGARFLHESTLCNSRYTAAANNLGFALARLGAYRQASEVLARALELQSTNTKIVTLKNEVDKKTNESRTFDFGPRVTWQDIPETIGSNEKNEPIAPPVVTNEVTNEVEKVVATTPQEKAEDKKWLEEATPLFLPVKSSGLEMVEVYGTGLVQFNNRSDSADNLREINLSESPTLEVTGEVVLEIDGKGELIVGDHKVEALDPECKFSVSTENGLVTCYAGTFNVSRWNTVQATRSTGRVTVSASNCQYVYAQDDSKIDARDCDKVTLVNQAQGTVDKCNLVILNDRARAVASNCQKLTIMAKARAKAIACEQIEELDQGKAE